ncbi:molybdenum cofactor guanylyltransferase MobA [Crenobacter caeni]|uniref:Molybdenum cofactor guanylyltransferase n=1 Tax=Crenobacter caeni TaxID=2705474 RepID=A0A6B2KQ42_9NEIS|nr:molybdenum cofactor guanylyltransferase MobA [Crenobacter caeni]NDV12254.1 molybdenum cofactor guanylyltransferase [Crenobacter caeni]
MIAGLILAGGEGSRMGGADKGACQLAGEPLACHVARRFAPQVDALWVSANRGEALYRTLGEVVPDLAAYTSMGPLAGIASCAQRLPAGALLAVAPCDTPCLPDDLVARLAAGLAAQPAAGAAYAVAPAGPHYALLLARERALAALPVYLARGGRAIRHWLATVHAIAVPFDDDAAFANANDAAALAALAARLDAAKP